ncbi:RNA-binding cell elongation regulator Jag/EloR [Paenibacillus wulumuqiensis]|uniref:RNA-binding cell elongation regulator Jag/EloR n=1 Tax=Paenibacillus wulumuqiensis TaxID=1567107 RepID=UPI000619EEAC|nr:RNA-binding cell elongation regulator Jag/EloR [Paenibacillus wulumuqiensis]
MTTVIASGKTIDDAIAEGLARLNTSKEHVQIRIVQQPSKGFLGLIGVKQAQVELTLVHDAPSQVSVPTSAPRPAPEQPQSAVPVQYDTEPMDTEADFKALSSSYEEAVQFVKDVGDSIGMELEVDVKRTRDGYVMSISGNDLGLLIGRRGQTLDALQYLVNIVANRYSDKYIRIMLDAENFRDRRRKTLEELADRLANRVIRSGKEVVLEPMSSQERKVIHARLQNHNRVKTVSKGEEPNRRVVITLR